MGTGTDADRSLITTIAMKEITVFQRTNIWILKITVPVWD